MAFHSYGESSYHSSDRSEYYRQCSEIVEASKLRERWRVEVYRTISESENKVYPYCYEPGANDPAKRMAKVLHALSHIKEGHEYWPFLKEEKENGYLSSLEEFTEHLYSHGYARRPQPKH